MPRKALTRGSEVHPAHRPTPLSIRTENGCRRGRILADSFGWRSPRLFSAEHFDLLFLLAPWVMAPLGLNLVAAQADRLAQMNVLVVRYLLFPAAALALLRASF